MVDPEKPTGHPPSLPPAGPAPLHPRRPEILFHPLSDVVNAGEVRYRDEIQPSELAYDDPAKWISRLQEHLRTIPFLVSVVPFRGRILELGAGSCWLGAELSKLPDVDKVVCLDVSRHILTAIAPSVISHLGGRTDKMTLVVGDFNKLQFGDGHFDFVVMDQALHHIPSADFAAVLREIQRVMGDSGRFVAVREPFVAPIPGYTALRKRNFGRHERQFGVVENIYTKFEWVTRIRDGGMTVTMVADALRPSPHARLKNTLKRVINRTGLRDVYLFFRPNYLIVAEKATAGRSGR